MLISSPICTSKVYASATAIVVIAGASALYLATSAVLIGLGFVKTDDTAWARLVDMLWYNEHLMKFKSGVVTWVENQVNYMDEQFIKSVAMAANEITQYNPATFAPDTIMNIPDLGRFPVVDVTNINNSSLSNLLYSKLDSVSIDFMNVKSGDSFSLINDVTYTITDYRIGDVNSDNLQRFSGFIVDYSKKGFLNSYSSYDDPKYIEPFPVQHSSNTLTYYSDYSLTSNFTFLEPHWQYDRNASGRYSFIFYFSSFLSVDLSGQLVLKNPYYHYYYNPEIGIYGSHSYADITSKKWLETPLDVPFGLTKDLPTHNIDEYGKETVKAPLAWGSNPAKEFAPSIDYPAVEKGLPITIPNTKAEVGSIPQADVQSGNPPKTEVESPATDKPIAKEAIDKLRPNLGLTDFFPFCIPFDLYKGLVLLSSSPVEPKWNLVIDIGYVKPWSVVIDLTQYEKLFIICRWFLTVLFCLGLATATHKYIKW